MNVLCDEILAVKLNVKKKQSKSAHLYVSPLWELFHTVKAGLENEGKQII